MSSDGKDKVDGRSTPEASARATARIHLVNRKRHLLAKCGAKARTTGKPCNNLAMANGRCRLHGGRVPNGRDWHRPVWPKAEARDAEDKLHRKLADLDKRAAKRARKLAKRTEAARAQHEVWQRAHRPGDPGKRAADREVRRQSRAAAKLFAEVPVQKPTVPEQTLERHLTALRAELDTKQTTSRDAHICPPLSIFD